MKKKVLFVCLGNICRSPAAEGIFLKMVEQAGLNEHIHVDSAGTGGWHVGDAPDSRMITHAQKRGYDLTQLEARQFTEEDFKNFDYILTMDHSNFKNVSNLDVKQKHLDKIQRLTTYCKIHDLDEGPDPYYDREQGFEHVLDLLEDACTELLAKIKGELK